jgi:hypothetical protein
MPDVRKRRLVQIAGEEAVGVARSGRLPGPGASQDDPRPE